MTTEPTATLRQLTPHLYTLEGSSCMGVLREGDRSILFDAGDPGLLPLLKEQGILHVELACFTHYHRDTTFAANTLAAKGTRIGVPEAERDYFAKVEGYWNNPALRWHLYNYHPDSFMLPESVPVHETYKPGDSFVWGPAVITILATPGHTDGSISYQVDVDGQRFIFCGDVICGDGRLWDGYSLQKGLGLMDYHGFFGARFMLTASLETIRSALATALIPAHGPLVTEPSVAIDRLLTRLSMAYRQYAATSALRHYYPQAFAEFDGDPGMMPIRPSLPIPDYLRHFETTWVIISESRAAFVIDCTNPAVADAIYGLHKSGEISSVEGLWVSHYHDDHVDGIARLKEYFDFPVFADPHVADVIEHPLAWRLPCISPNVVKVDHRNTHGERWIWREFALTAFHLPGQTIYHGGLLCEGRGERLFFTGDSFTPAGIDDYCTGNRNWLGSGQGLDAAVSLTESLAPDLLFNAHVDVAFHFRPEDYNFMRRNLAGRELSFGELVYWDHPNYGLDPYWVRCMPYEQHLAPGAVVRLAVVIHNHSSTPQPASAQLVFPASWNLDTPSASALCPARVDQAIEFEFHVPNQIKPGRWIIAANLIYAGRQLGAFREAILIVE